jgi:hypothetical protein
MTTPRTARDIAGLGSWTSFSLLVQAGLAGAGVAVALSHGTDFIAASESYSLISLLQLLAFVAAGGLFLRWTYLATVNAHAFRAEGLRFGPWLAVGSYFIPIANLVMPLQSMRDTWKATVEPRDWEVVRVPAVLGLWWFLWLTSNIAGIAAFRLSDAARYPDMGELAETLTMLSDGLTLGSSALLSTIVRRLSGLQQVRVDAIATGVTPTRPGG